ncbi:MAG: LysM peptidoglycan-binding domain-containing protein [Bacteroidales bacterium]|nr:MAG: LysM peptidoglycan-binding domain-containing protein [Bacteroidales bacterium]
MKKFIKYPAIIVCVLIFNSIRAQVSNPAIKDSTLERISLSMDFNNNLDSLLNLWYVQQSVDSNNLIVGIEIDSTLPIINLPDSVYIKRLARINSAIDLPYNSIVRSYISMYTHNKKDLVGVMMGLSDYYFPIFEEILDIYQLPQEFRFLPIIESALNPRAVSRVGATGLWQFMYGTGRMYKLTINSYVDERRDPIASTHAAARFIKDLYSIYKDWTLVIAAYNCGPGNVNKAIRRAGGKKNYWDIYYYLPRETRGYVPAFIAANYAYYYHKEHNIKPQAINVPLTSDTLMVNKLLHLQQVSEVLGIPINLIRDLNPQFKLDIIPARERAFALKLPVDAVGSFIDKEKEIFAYKDSVFFNRKNSINPIKYTSSYQYDVPAGSVKYDYRVQSGDVLGTIAERFGVTASQLRSWNNIYGNMIRVNQKLAIYVSPRVAAQLGITAPKQQSTSKVEAGYIVHTVKAGDTLWTIARQYPGVSGDDIIKINNLKSDRVYPGQTLKIKPKS